MRRIALIGCGKEKRAHRAKASALYTGALFTKALAHATAANFDAVFILSAKHGVLELDEEIEPYDLKLADFDLWELREWGFAVYQQLELRFATVTPTDLVIYAGEQYVEPIRWHLVDLPLWGIVEPLKGLGIGERLRWFNQHAFEAHP